MTFLISKLIGGLLAPGTLLLIALAGAFAMQRRRPHLSRALLGASLLFVAALSLMPIGRWLIQPLETCFPPPSALKLDHVDGIIVLGGGINADDAYLSGQPALNDAGDRLTAFVALSRQYPDAQLVWSGGSAEILSRGRHYSESAAAEQLFGQLRVAPGRVRYERESRNTWENAVYTQRMVDPKPGQTWLLVTSAWHMPRAVGIFRRLGWTVVPYQVDYLGNDPAAWAKFEAPRELYTISMAVKEWIGLLSYRLLGRTSELLPRESETQGKPT